MPRIEAVGLAKRFGRITALEKGDLTIEDGEYVAILGPSGCGKTTLIKLLAGIWEPTEGRVLVDGKDVTNLGVEDRDLGYVFQNIVLFPHMNVWRNATYGPWVHDRTPADVDHVGKEVLELVQMLQERGLFPAELSTGSQQKVALARALANRARLLMLDEPLSALDTRVRLDLRYALRRIVKDLGLTAIHVTHDQEEAMSVADRVVVMRKGQTVEQGPPERLYNHPQGVFTANFVGESNFLEGAVRRIRADWAFVELRSGYVLRVPAKGLLEGDPVVLAARPEWLTITKEGFGNVIPGRVEGRHFLGATERLQVRLFTSDLVSIDVPTSQSLNSARDVMVSFHETNILVYPRPYAGLQEALKLE
ncbi:MAG TPA: ABC transporter ATP-binding protein [Thermoplasmata archaeon]|nr:ABC transporter ATP-binding protein [Thermoplasmata archaeon]